MSSMNSPRPQGFPDLPRLGSCLPPSTHRALSHPRSFQARSRIRRGENPPSAPFERNRGSAPRRAGHGRLPPGSGIRARPSRNPRLRLRSRRVVPPGSSRPARRDRSPRRCRARSRVPRNPTERTRARRPPPSTSKSVKFSFESDGMQGPVRRPRPRASPSRVNVPVFGAPPGCRRRKPLRCLLGERVPRPPRG